MIFGILIKKSALPSLYVYRDVEIKRKYIQTYTERFTEKAGSIHRRYLGRLGALGYGSMAIVWLK